MRHRSLLIGLAMLAVATISIAVAVAALFPRLPEPEQADQQGLFRWLVQTHLRDEPQDIQNRLLNRVEKELNGGIDLTQCLSQIDKDQCARLLENVDRLAECWFLREARRYFAEPESGRMTLINRQADRVRQLGILDQIATIEGHGNGTVSAKMAAAADNAARLERWLADVAPHERQRVSEYFSTLRAALVWNSIQQWVSPLKFPAAKPAPSSPKASAQGPAVQAASQAAS